MRRLRLGLWALAGLAAIAGVVIALNPPPPGSKAPLSRETSIASIGGPFTLTGSDGKPFASSHLLGNPAAIFFGFTRCPDVCPTTMLEMKEVMRKLGPDADKVQVLFVTLDPERDTQQVLAQYVPAFDPRFLGLFGDSATTLKTAKEFKVFYEKRPGSSPGAYTIDHTAASFVFDRKGRLRLYVKHDQIGTLPDDIRTLLNEPS